jgi:HEAT repeat protein
VYKELFVDMPAEIAKLQRYLKSDNKEARLKAIKLLLFHPQATPLQLTQSLCSEDNRDFEFLQVFELDRAMREAWERLRGVNDEEVYEYLDSLYASDPKRHRYHVVLVLQSIGTERSLNKLKSLRRSAPPEFDGTFLNAICRVLSMIEEDTDQ